MGKSTLNIGKELHGDSLMYRIESVLGQGSFGITYKAKAFTMIKGKFGEELVETNTPKAIKEFFMKEVNEREESGSITGMSEGGLSYNYAQKFKKEAENLASMNHPNIVKVIDFINANNTYYYVMDFIEGENLNDYLKHQKMSEKDATDTIIEVAKALKYMHEEKHMLHLDLKPGNIMRRESDGHIFLIDFGLSKHYSEEGVPETSTSVGLGTPGYAPIEQANSKNAKKFRETLDVYALGATFYKLLTGQTPPYADEMLPHGEIVRNELNKFGVSEILISIVVHAMFPIVDERMQHVKDFVDSLDAIEISEKSTPKQKKTSSSKYSKNKLFESEDDKTVLDINDSHVVRKNSRQNKRAKKKSKVAFDGEEYSHKGDYNNIESKANLIDKFVVSIMVISLVPTILACFDIFIIPEFIFHYLFLGGSIEETTTWYPLGTLLISASILLFIIFLVQDIFKLQKNDIIIKAFYCCISILFIILVYFAFIFFK